MPAAPAPPPHTPVNFLKAGGMGGFSAECVALLAKAGYHPDDFGNYDAVRGQIQVAKAKRMNYVAAEKAAGRKPDPNGPDARTAMLARSQSGHISQDAIFKKQGGRNDACKNYVPPGDAPADSRCYNTADAPCMPMQTTSDGSRGQIGSPHWAVGQSENGVPPGPANAGAISAQAEKNVGLCTQETAKDKKNYDQEMDKHADRNQAAAKQKKITEAEARRADTAATQQGAASELQAKGGGAAAAAKEGEITGDTAAKCVENYRKKAFEEMRKKNREKYGSNFPATEKEAKKELKEAKKAAADPINKAPFNDHAAKIKSDAENELKDPNLSADRRAVMEARARSPHAFVRGDRRAAGERVERAQAEVDGLDCMHKQANSLNGVDSLGRKRATPPPSWGGNFPGGPGNS